MIRSLLCLCLAGLTAAPAPAQEETGEDEQNRPTLAQLARAADLIALIQVGDTDYATTRGFPSGGTAILRVLIPYKVTRPLPDRLEVYEEGLHPNECYFETPTVAEEGRRHLVFLKTNPDVPRQYVGLDAGCALDVLVMRDNRYALRYPLSGIGVADDVSELARPMEFRDPYAYVDDDELPVEERKRLLAAGMLEAVDGGRYLFTHGIELGALRELLGEEALTRDRALLRTPD